MGKTDSFGRPYYETAEEYNKAHRQAKASGTYGQMQQEKRAYSHTTGRGAKKKYGQKSANSTVAIMGIGVGIIIVAIMTIFVNTMIDSSGIQQENWYEEEYIEQDPNYEMVGVDDVPLEEGFNEFTFEGIEYTIPMTYGEFCMMPSAFMLDVYPTGDLDVGEVETLDIVDEDRNYLGYLTIRNVGDEEMDMGDCPITFMMLHNDSDITFANGLDYTCSYEDIECNLGFPTSQYSIVEEDGSLYEEYHWIYSHEAGYESFTACFVDGELSWFSIEKSPV